MPQQPKYPTGPQIWRLQQILEFLRAGRRVNARRLSEEFQVSRRTIASDISYLRTIGVPLVYDFRTGTYSLTEPFDNLPTVALSRTDLATFLVARYALEALSDTPHAQLLSQIMTRLAKFLPETIRVEPDAFSRTLRFESGPRTPSPPDNILVLEKAAHEQRVVHILYHSNYRDETIARDVEPYAVLCRDGRWYLIANCRLRKAFRDFRLDRIRDLQLLEEVFVCDPQFNLDEYLGPSFGVHRGDRTYSIRVRFSSYQARWIREEVWHETQRMERLPDGSLEVTFQATGLTDLTRWVLSYGSDVEVLEPEELKQLVANHVRLMAKMYADQGMAYEVPGIE